MFQLSSGDIKKERMFLTVHQNHVIGGALVRGDGLHAVLDKVDAAAPELLEHLSGDGLVDVVVLDQQDASVRQEVVTHGSMLNRGRTCLAGAAAHDPGQAGIEV